MKLKESGSAGTQAGRHSRVYDDGPLWGAARRGQLGRSAGETGRARGIKRPCPIGKHTVCG